MHICFYRDPATGEPHIYNHGVPKRKSKRSSVIPVKTAAVGKVLGLPSVKHGLGGPCGSSICQTPSQKVYLSSPHMSCEGSRWRRIDGGSVGKDSDETGQISTRLG